MTNSTRFLLTDATTKWLHQFQIGRRGIGKDLLHLIERQSP